MALIKCPNCGKEISDKAIRCVHCGYVLKKESNSPKREESNKNGHEKVPTRKENIIEKEPEKLSHKDSHKKQHFIILIFICIIVGLIILISILLLRQSNNKKINSETTENSNINKTYTASSVLNEADSDTTDSTNRKTISEDIIYQKTVYDGNDGRIVLEKVTSNGLTLKITSKLQNRTCTFSAYSIGFDGEQINLNQDDDQTIKPGETVEQRYSGTISKLSHRYLSMTGEFFDDQDTGLGQFEITNFDIGGQENLMYPNEQGSVIHDTDTINVRYIQCGGKGVRLLITNKTASAIELSLDSLTVDGKTFNEDDLILDPSEILGNTVGYIDIDLISVDEDIVPDKIKNVNGSMEYYDENSGDTLEKFSFDIKNQ